MLHQSIFKLCLVLALYKAIRKKVMELDVRRNLEETFDIKTFFKMSIRRKCLGPEVEQ